MVQRYTLCLSSFAYELMNTPKSVKEAHHTSTFSRKLKNSPNPLTLMGFSTYVMCGQNDNAYMTIFRSRAFFPSSTTTWRLNPKS